MQKYGFDDARPVLERATARETAARVALGTVAQAFLRQVLGVEVVSHVVSIGAARRRTTAAAGPGGPRAGSTPTPVRALDPECRRGDGRRDRGRAKDGDTLGGVVEVLAYGLPPASAPLCMATAGSTPGWPER